MDLTFGSERTAEDILSGRLRLRLASQWYILPVLTVGQNADWLTTLEGAFASLAQIPDDDLDGIMQVLIEADSQLLDFIYSYDVTHVLPPKKTIERDVYPHEVLRAVMEVRLAANPTVGYGLAVAAQEVRAMKAQQMKQTAPSPRTSSSRRRTAGQTGKSGTN